jgi:pimeloyl-ACP methyl ester carboxylesterase
VRWVAILFGVVFGVYALLVMLVGLVFLPAKPRPQTDRDRFADVLGTRIAYRVTEGSGPTLILLHGFGGSLLDWEGMLGRLKCGRLFSIDSIGFGLSGRPNLTYELETHRRHLVAFMDALGIDKAILVGRSFGASLTLWTAAHTPERIVGAIAMAPSGMPGELTAPWPKSFLFRPGWPNSMADWIAHTPPYVWLFENSLARQALGISGSYDERFSAAMPKIRQPTLLLWSTGDRTAQFSYSKRFLELIPHARLITFPPSAGHDVANAQPELTASSVCDFVHSVAD